MSEQPFEINEERAEQQPQDTSLEKAVGRKIGYLIAIIVELVVFWFLRRLDRWGAPVVTPDWAQVIPALRASVGATILVNIVYIVYDPRWVRRLGQIFTNLFGLGFMWAVYRAFPFTFGPSVAGWVRIGLIVVMAAMALATVVEAVKLVLGGRD